MKKEMKRKTSEIKRLRVLATAFRPAAETAVRLAIGVERRFAAKTLFGSAATFGGVGVEAIASAFAFGAVELARPDGSFFVVEFFADAATAFAALFGAKFFAELRIRFAASRFGEALETRVEASTSRRRVRVFAVRNIRFFPDFRSFRVVFFRRVSHFDFGNFERAQPRFGRRCVVGRSSGSVKFGDFFRSQAAELSRRHFAEFDRADLNALQLHHFVSEARQHATDFAVFPFRQGDFENGTHFVAGFNNDVVRLNDAFGNVDAAFEVAGEFAIDESGDLHFVFFRRFETRVGQAFGERAVVGEEDKAFAVLVETADGEESAEAFGDEVENASPTLRVAVRAKRVFRLVEGEVNRFRFRERFAVDADPLFVRENADAEFRNDDAVELDASFLDELFALASASVSGRGENFLQAVSEFFGERVVGVGGFRFFDRSRRVRENGVGGGAFLTGIGEARSPGFRSAGRIESRLAVAGLRLRTRMAGAGGHGNLRKTSTRQKCAVGK